ncbi:hypothetical protein ATANTOWER_021056 [Ataeniobius toweri]|uniref:Uncharacterized protein n=1 Tax=Ataeniobius toweri TaxID=208326 RepID=A0ABU7AGC3_9TELE|nr:hypothetical protein [Ataeniobius toweri]
MSVYAAACRDALLNSSSGSRDINRSRGGPGAAIVFQRITDQSTTNTIYSKQQANHCGRQMSPPHLDLTKYLHTNRHLEAPETNDSTP